MRYTTLDDLLAQSDIITLHCPLTPENKHMIDWRALEKMRTGVMLVNTSRGALLDTVAVIEALKSGKIGYLGLDVYEEEEEIFFEDRSGLIIPDDVFARLLMFPNVIVTGHQAFFTREALLNIASYDHRQHHQIRKWSASGKAYRLARLIPMRPKQAQAVEKLGRLRFGQSGARARPLAWRSYWRGDLPGEIHSRGLFH